MSIPRKHLLEYPTAEASEAFHVRQAEASISGEPESTSVKAGIIAQLTRANIGLRLRAVDHQNQDRGTFISDTSATVDTTSTTVRSEVAINLVSTTEQDPATADLNRMIETLSQSNLKDKHGRRKFSDACADIRTQIGKMRSKVGKKGTFPDFSKTLIQALQRNSTLSNFLESFDGNQCIIDIRTLTPKIISGLRHLAKEFPGIQLMDGFSSQYLESMQMTEMTVRLPDGQGEVSAYAPFNIDPKLKKKDRKEFSTQNIRDFLRRTQEEGTWVLLIGHDQHKLNKEYIAVPKIGALIRRGGNYFLLAVNTIINAVLNENKGVIPSREHLSARVVRVPKEAGEDHLSSLHEVGDFPMVYLGKLGQQLVIKVDKTNRDEFERLKLSLASPQ